MNLPSPNGCRRCGIERRGHYRRWTTGVGWHKFTEPTDEQRLARMVDRRESREPLEQLLAADQDEAGR